jgi:hypothetical protein
MSDGDDTRAARMRCLVCGRVNESVTMTLTSGTSWNDCGHSTANLIKRAMLSSLTPEERWPVVAAVAQEALEIRRR